MIDIRFSNWFYQKSYILSSLGYSEVHLKYKKTDMERLS